MTAEPVALEAHPDGTVVPVRVTPRSSRTGILGVREGTLCIAVHAPPEKGKANLALLRFLAKRLGLPRSRFALLTGETSRVKRILISGRSPEAVRAGLEDRA